MRKNKGFESSNILGYFGAAVSYDLEFFGHLDEVSAERFIEPGRCFARALTEYHKK